MIKLLFVPLCFKTHRLFHFVQYTKILMYENISAVITNKTTSLNVNFLSYVHF